MVFHEPPSLVHGDFWPENVLWQHGQIAAVVDWEDAALGDPLSDLACCQVELLCKYDEAAMDTFTAHYCALAQVDLANLPLWQVYVSADAGDRWAPIVRDLPAVLSVEVQTLP